MREDCSGTCSGSSCQASQYHPADENEDGCIDIGELADYISEWKSGRATMSQLMAAVTMWKSGDGCSVPTCSEGSITSTCTCGGSEYSSGYCCSGSWQATSCTPSSAYYVSNSGSDSGSGTISDPFATLEHAMYQAGAGDTIYLRGGTYSEGQIWYTNPGGDSGAYLTVTEYPGEEAVLSGVNLVLESKYIRIRDLSFQGSEITVRRWEGSGYAVVSHNIEILDNYFSHDDVTIWFNCNNGLIEGNHFENAWYAIYMMHGDGNIIRDNYIEQTSHYSIHIYDEDKYSYGGENNPRITNLLVEDNHIMGSDTRAGIVISAGESTNLGIEIDGVIVRNNIIANNAGAGIALYYYGSINDVDIENNVVLNSATGVDIDAVDVSNIVIKNNIFSSNSQQIYSDSVSNLVVEYNLYYQPQSVGGASDSHAVYGDPLLTTDYHVQSSSPACGSGEGGSDIGVYPC